MYRSDDRAVRARSQIGSRSLDEMRGQETNFTTCNPNIRVLNFVRKFQKLKNRKERIGRALDAVLGLVVAERLFSDFGDDEGRLTRARADLVRREITRVLES